MSRTLMDGRSAVSVRSRFDDDDVGRSIARPEPESLPGRTGPGAGRIPSAPMTGATIVFVHRPMNMGDVNFSPRFAGTPAHDVVS